jgi:hypothetical protein
LKDSNFSGLPSLLDVVLTDHEFWVYVGRRQQNGEIEKVMQKIGMTKLTHSKFVNFTPFIIKNLLEVNRRRGIHKHFLNSLRDNVKNFVQSIC